MNAVFADTSFLVAIVSDRDDAHPAGVRFTEDPRRRFVTTDYVVWEVANFLAKGARRRSRFLTLRARLLVEPSVRIVRATGRLTEDGIALYAKHRDKDWSLTDCISFVVMRRLRLTDALTADHHFVQAGFRALLT